MTGSPKFFFFWRGSCCLPNGGADPCGAALPSSKQTSLAAPGAAESLVLFALFFSLSFLSMARASARAQRVAQDALVGALVLLLIFLVLTTHDDAPLRAQRHRFVKRGHWLLRCARAIRLGNVRTYTFASAQLGLPLACLCSSAWLACAGSNVFTRTSIRAHVSAAAATTAPVWRTAFFHGTDRGSQRRIPRRRTTSRWPCLRKWSSRPRPRSMTRRTGAIRRTSLARCASRVTMAICLVLATSALAARRVFPDAGDARKGKSGTKHVEAWVTAQSRFQATAPVPSPQLASGDAQELQQPKPVKFSQLRNSSVERLQDGAALFERQRVHQHSQPGSPAHSRSASERGSPRLLAYDSTMTPPRAFHICCKSSGPLSLAADAIFHTSHAIPVRFSDTSSASPAIKTWISAVP